MWPAKQNPTRLNFSQASFMTFHYVPRSKKQLSVKVLASVVLKLQWQTAGWTKHQITPVYKIYTEKKNKKTDAYLIYNSEKKQAVETGLGSLSSLFKWG